MSSRSRLIVFVGIVVAGIAATTIYASRQGLGEARACMDVPKSQQRINCLQPIILKVALEQSPAEALTLAEEYQSRGIIAECHLLAHYVGEQLYRRNPADVATSISSCSDKCVEGCYHGVMAEMLSKQVERQNIATTVNGLCAPVKNDPLTYKQCVHGIGHGLLTHNFLTLEEAVRTCRGMTGQLEPEACLDGVFMENMFPVLALSDSAVKERLPRVCGSMIQTADHKLIAKCIFEIGDVLMMLTQYDLPRAEGLCSGMQPEYVESCKEAARTWKTLQAAQTEKTDLR